MHRGRHIPIAVSLGVIGLLVASTSVRAGSLTMPMQLVPGGGLSDGPAYDFWMGQYEVTVAQYIAFLNDAEANADNDRGAYMVFDPNTGDVGLVDGSYTDVFFDISDATDPLGFGPEYAIAYDANLPPGQRYTYDPNDSDYPMNGMAWIGAVKFCNWLTLEMGLDPNQRCYTEGPSVNDWHPVTIAKTDWIDGDLDDAQRQSLIDDYVGFRLPMDNLGFQSGYIDGQPNLYNEWYKATAYDPNAPDTTRIGEHDESIPPYHWTYGYGSDELSLFRANFTVYDSNAPEGVDPNTVRTTVPVGSYAAGNNNPWGIEDLCGNVYEWGQDYGNTLDPIRHATHGKGYNSSEPAAALRHYRRVYNGTHFVGLRVVQCGQFHLTLDTVNGALGQAAVEPNLPTYPPGTAVTLAATPIPGETFAQWEGDVPPERQLDNPLTVTMNRDRQITAVFGKPPIDYTLTVDAIGQGDVSPESETYVEGTEVKVTASSDDGWEFSGWQGDVPAGKELDNPLTVTMDQDRDLAAIFTEIPPDMYSLAANTIGQGGVSPESGTYEDGTPVDLLATPEDGWIFDTWQGDVAGEDRTDPNLTVVMSRDRTVTAVFVEAPPILLTLTIQATGQGEAIPDSGPYTNGTPVTILAKPANGWQFEGWTGDVPAGHEDDNPMTIDMDRHRTVIAAFTEVTSSTDPDAAPCAAPPAAALAVLACLAMVAGRPRRRVHT